VLASTLGTAWSLIRLAFVVISVALAAVAHNFSSIGIADEEIFQLRIKYATRYSPFRYTRIWSGNAGPRNQRHPFVFDHPVQGLPTASLAPIAWLRSLPASDQPHHVLLVETAT
jgi:hypothetical protein